MISLEIVNGGWYRKREGLKDLSQQATWRLIKDLYVVFIFDCYLIFISCILKFMKMFSYFCLVYMFTVKLKH